MAKAFTACLVRPWAYTWAKIGECGLLALMSSVHSTALRSLVSDCWTLIESTHGSWIIFHVFNACPCGEDGKKDHWKIGLDSGCLRLSNYPLTGVHWASPLLQNSYSVARHCHIATMYVVSQCISPNCGMVQAYRKGGHEHRCALWSLCGL